MKIDWFHILVAISLLIIVAFQSYQVYVAIKVNDLAKKLDGLISGHPPSQAMK